MHLLRDLCQMSHRLSITFDPIQNKLYECVMIISKVCVLTPKYFVYSPKHCIPILHFS